MLYAHALVEGNINVPSIEGGENSEQRTRLHLVLVRTLVLEKGKQPLGPAP